MRNAGFTLIELVMVILVVGILAAVAIPEFVDFRTDANNAKLKGITGSVRAAIAISRAAIALREDDGVNPYPTATELLNNAYDPIDHPALSGTKIMDSSSSKLDNPWTDPVWLAFNNFVIDCTGMTQGDVWAIPDVGWCYNPTNGQFWANSSRNNQALTENTF